MLLLLPLAACISAGARDDIGPPVPITYSRSGCEGTCPVFEVTVTDRSGVFRGRYFTRVRGERRFAFTPEQYRNFAAVLAPYRPKGMRLIVARTSGCRNAPTDLPSINVQWGERDRLGFYTGCRGAANARIGAALGRAEAILPIADLIGPR